MHTIEELTISRKDLFYGLKKSVRDAFIVYGSFLLAGWITIGASTGIWNPKDYIKDFKENTNVSNKSHLEMYPLF